MKEENEIFQSDLPWNHTQGQVFEDQLQHTDLLGTHWVDPELQCIEAFVERLIRLLWFEGRL